MRCLKVSVLFFLSRSSDNRFIKVPYVLVLVIFLSRLLLLQGFIHDFFR